MNDGDRGVISNIIQTVVDKIDTWKKALLLIFMVSCFLFLGVLYEYRHDFKPHLFPKVTDKKINTGKLPSEISTLMLHTGAKSSWVWEVDFSYNTKFPLYIVIDSKIINLKNSPADILLRNNDRFTMHLINIINNKFDCWPSVNTESFTSHAEDNWLCASAIPPTSGEIKGILIISLENKPRYFDSIKLSLQIASDNLTK